MKIERVFCAFFILLAWGSFSAATCFSAVSFDVTNITAASQTLTLKVIISGDNNLSAGGFALTFPADRLVFAGASDIEGVVLETNVSGSTLTAGYMVTGPAVNRLEFKFDFNINGQGPYIIAPNSAAFRDDLAGCNGSRPGIFSTSGVSSPVMWSVPDSTANLFLYIPRLSEITDIKLRVGGQDVLYGVAALSAWFVDPVMDVAYLVMPGIDLPAGSYPLILEVTYGEHSETVTTDVVVNQGGI